LTVLFRGHLSIHVHINSISKHVILYNCCKHFEKSPSIVT